MNSAWTIRKRKDPLYLSKPTCYIRNWSRTILGQQNSKWQPSFVSLPSSLPGDNGLFGDVGERIFSRVVAMDGVIGVLGGELTWEYKNPFIKRCYGRSRKTGHVRLGHTTLARATPGYPNAFHLNGGEEYAKLLKLDGLKLRQKIKAIRVSD